VAQGATDDRRSWSGVAQPIVRPAAMLAGGNSIFAISLPFSPGAAMRRQVQLAPTMVRLSSEARATLSCTKPCRIDYDKWTQSRIKIE
jgi:hypothetical protein